jgi:hypothetical protein
VQCFDHPVIHLACIDGMNVGMSKINQLKVFVILFFLPTLLVFDEEVNMSEPVVEAHCWKH